jgi:hypothetical protein
MSRNIPAAYVSSSVTLVQPYYAAYLSFPTAPVRLWTGAYTKSFSDEFGGGSYLGVGTMGNISAITETTEIAARGMDLTLSGIPTEYVSLALSGSYRGGDVAVYLILFNTNMSSFEKLTIFKGTMDQMIINENGSTSAISVKCESRLIALNRPRDIRYTDESQTLLYPNDTGLRFVASMADKSIYWGNSAPGSTGNSGGSENAGGGDGSNNNGPE